MTRQIVTSKRRSQRKAPPPVLREIKSDRLGGKVWTPSTELGESRLIDKREMLFLVPLSYPTVWKLMQEGEFPRAVAVGQRNYWRELEVRDWIKSRSLRRFKNDKVRA